MFSQIVIPDGLTFAVFQGTGMFQNVEIYLDLDLFMKISKILPNYHLWLIILIITII